MLEKFTDSKKKISKQLFCSGEVRGVAGVGRELSVGQVVWAPPVNGDQYLVFVGWPSDARKLGIKYCYNRPCALYAVKAPSFKSDTSVSRSVTSYKCKPC